MLADEIRKLGLERLSSLLTLGQGENQYDFIVLQCHSKAPPSGLLAVHPVHGKDYCSTEQPM